MPSVACNVTLYETREGWLADRRNWLGASEVPAVLGIGYASQSPVSVWHAKVSGQELEHDAETQRRLAVGRHMEPVIADLFEKETGIETVFDFQNYRVYRHRTCPWLGATLDTTTVEGTPVELKNVHARFRREWDRDVEPPLKHQVQCQVQMACTESDSCYLVGLVGGEDLVIHELRRNDRFLGALYPKLERFWQYVQDREMPPVDDSQATAAALRQMFRTDLGGEIALPDEFAKVDEELIGVKEQMATLEKQRMMLENRIKAAIGNHAIGRLANGAAYSWRAVERKGYTVEPSVVRTLRRIKGDT